MLKDTLLIGETIEQIIKRLNELKERNDIKKVEIKIHKYWMGDYYETEFKVYYNIAE